MTGHDQPAATTSQRPMEWYRNDWATVYRGDCLEVMPTLDAGSCGLIVSDLPYGMTDCKWDTHLPLDRLWAEWKRLLAPGRAAVLTASQPFTSTLVASNPKTFKHEWIWEKNAGSNFGTVKHQPMKEHESVLVFGWGKVLYQPIMQERAASGLARVQTVVNYDTSAEAYSSGGLTATASSKRPDLRYPRSIQRFNRERGLHPTQKPVALIEYLIQTYTEPGDLVLDPCMGSGTTLVAAGNLGRRAIGIEIEDWYCSVGARRLVDDVQERLL
jgi:site-specific DNA-methyltransferase (adenine-specific)